MARQGRRFLGEFAGGRDNNFNLIRMLAASGVLVSHAYPIALGNRALQPFEAATGYTLGWICVAIFFAISGFLITRSFERSSTRAEWISARVMRLFPALAVVLGLTVLFYGPAFTTLDISAYATRVETWTYMPRNLGLVLLQPGLPGTFADHPFPIAINGSLWTLVHEVTCYGGVFIVGILGLLGSRRMMALALVVYATTFVVTGIPTVAENLPGRLVALRELSYPFAIGMAFHVWRDAIRLSWIVAVLIAAASWAAYGTFLFQPLFVAAIAYATFVLAYLPGGALRRYNALGDYSYGVYVYAFPAQQAAIALAGPMSPLENMAFAIPVTLACAVASWHLIEKPALERRHELARLLGKDRGAPARPTPSHPAE